MSRLIPAAALCAALALAAPLGAKGPAPAPGPVFTPSELPYPFSSAVQVGDVLYLSGQHGLSFDDVFKCSVFLADMADWPAFNTIYARHFRVCPG